MMWITKAKWLFSATENGVFISPVKKFILILVAAFP